MHGGGINPVSLGLAGAPVNITFIKRCKKWEKRKKKHKRHRKNS